MTSGNYDSGGEYFGQNHAASSTYDQYLEAEVILPGPSKDDSSKENNVGYGTPNAGYGTPNASYDTPSAIFSFDELSSFSAQHYEPEKEQIVVKPHFIINEAELQKMETKVFFEYTYPIGNEKKYHCALSTEGDLSIEEEAHFMTNCGRKMIFYGIILKKEESDTVRLLSCNCAFSAIGQGTINTWLSQTDLDNTISCSNPTCPMNSCGCWADTEPFTCGFSCDTITYVMPNIGTTSIIPIDVSDSEVLQLQEETPKQTLKLKKIGGRLTEQKKLKRKNQELLEPNGNEGKLENSEKKPKRKYTKSKLFESVTDSKPEEVKLPKKRGRKVGIPPIDYEHFACDICGITCAGYEKRYKDLGKNVQPLRVIRNPENFEIEWCNACACVQLSWGARGDKIRQEKKAKEAEKLAKEAEEMEKQLGDGMHALSMAVNYPHDDETEPTIDEQIRTGMPLPNAPSQFGQLQNVDNNNLRIASALAQAPSITEISAISRFGNNRASSGKKKASLEEKKLENRKEEEIVTKSKQGKAKPKSTSTKRKRVVEEESIPVQTPIPEPVQSQAESIRIKLEQQRQQTLELELQLATLKNEQLQRLIEKQITEKDNIATLAIQQNENLLQRLKEISEQKDKMEKEKNAITDMALRNYMLVDFIPTGVKKEKKLIPNGSDFIVIAEDTTDQKSPEEPAKVIQIEELAKVIQADEPAKVVQPKEPTKVIQPEEPAKESQPEEPAKDSQPEESRMEIVNESIAQDVIPKIVPEINKQFDIVAIPSNSEPVPEVVCQPPQLKNIQTAEAKIKQKKRGLSRELKSLLSEVRVPARVPADAPTKVPAKRAKKSHNDK